MNRHLGGCSFIAPGQTVADGLRMLRQFELRYADVGIGGGNAHFNPVDVAISPMRYATETKAALGQADIQPVECFLLNFGWPINASDAALQQRTIKLFAGICTFAADVGFRSVMLIPGPIDPAIGQADSIARSADMLRQLLPLAHDAGLALHVEPDSESCTHTPDAVLDLLAQVPGLKLTLDYSHFICQGIPQDAVEVLNRHAGHVHVRQARPADIVTDVAIGCIDYYRILHQLSQLNYAGVLCIEYLALDRSASAAEQALARTADMVRSLNQMD